MQWMSRRIAGCIVVAVFAIAGCATSVQTPTDPGPNAVDTISSKSGAIGFLQTYGPSWASTDDPYYDNPCDTMQDLIPRYFKVDCNDDGRTDLIINGSRAIYASIDNGDGTFSTFLVGRRRSTRLLFVREVVHRSPRTIIVVDNLPNACLHLDSKPLPPDTLVIVGGFLMDQSPAPSTQQITSVTMVSQGCHGACPKYTLRMDMSGRASYTAGEFCDSTGEFTGIVEAQRVDRLFEALQYMNPMLYGDQLWSETSDYGVFAFTFTFKDGSTKQIVADAVASTSFTSIINTIDALRTSQQWRRK